MFLAIGSVSLLRAQAAQASSSPVIDQRAHAGDNCAVSATKSHAAIGFELKIEYAVADPTQPVVFNRLADRGSSDRPDNSAVP
jgi:hypothetical protein